MVWIQLSWTVILVELPKRARSEQGRTMHPYTPFVDQVQYSLEAVYGSTSQTSLANSDALLTGEIAAASLRELIPLATLRSMGSFFTSSQMAEVLWEGAIDTLKSDSVVVDPACGAGDLLIPAVRRLLDLGAGTAVAKQVRGIDLESGFVAAARARLELSAKLANPALGVTDFEQIETHDFFEDTAKVLEGATHVVMNPPFITMDAPEGCTWGNKGINAAALFLDLCIQYCTPGTRIIAILPEVFRSGSRYLRWRMNVEDHSTQLSIKTLGQFDASTDIDVFRLEALVGEPSAPTFRVGESRTVWHPDLPTQRADQETLSDYCQINVGPVVPHRHPDEGRPFPFVAARGLPAWAIIDSISTTRGFKGRKHQGPFVVVRRTSRPGEVHRARATVVASTKEVAVENHLLVLTPLDGTLDTCLKISSLLAMPETTEYLNKRIKCRHLTVGALLELPWIKEES